MAHYSRIDKIVIDVAPADHDEAVAFWSGATGGLTQGQQFPEYHWAEIPGQDIGFLLQRLEEGASRIHIDIHTTDLDAEVARLEQLGAKRVRQIHGWWIMQDPAGLPFCVIPDSTDRLDDDNAQRWD